MNLIIDFNITSAFKKHGLMDRDGNIDEEVAAVARNYICIAGPEESLGCRQPIDEGVLIYNRLVGGVKKWVWSFFGR